MSAIVAPAAAGQLGQTEQTGQANPADQADRAAQTGRRLVGPRASLRPRDRSLVLPRFVLWAVLAAALSAVAYRESWRQVFQVALHPLSVIDQRMVHSWGVLALCLAALALKRRAIAALLYQW